jgi:hypothetical protein
MESTERVEEALQGWGYISPSLPQLSLGAFALAEAKSYITKRENAVF